MPAQDIVAQAAGKDVSLATLEELAERYEVSIEAVCPDELRGCADYAIPSQSFTPLANRIFQQAQV